MASRSHVDVNERRLRPIYDCLDNGNNKKAIQEADKVLKKQKDLTCARVLKALALLRMGRHAEGSSILMAIHAMEPTEEQTLNAMSICYKEMQQYHNIALLYEAAAKHQPNNEDILSCLFMAHVRLGNYQQQQRTAMLLHKLRPNKNPYYFWAVMSIVMQAHSDSKLGKAMYLPLAEKMTHRYIKEEKIEADAEILLYLIILELQEKWEETLVVLEGPLGARLGGNELNLRETRLALMYTKLSKWDKVSVIYKEMLNHTPDDWAFWLKYLESGFHLVDEGFVAPEEEDSKDREEGESSNKVKPDGTVQAMLDFVDEKIQSSKKDVLLRGPFLARLELLRQLLGRQDSATQTMGKPLELLKEYFELFGHKACCHGDMKLFVHLLSEEELEELLEFMKANVDLTSTNEDIKYAKDIQQMTRHMVLLQLSRTVGYHGRMEIQEALRLSKELLLRAREGLKFGDKLLTTDLQFSDDYLLLAVHLLLDVWKKTGDDIHIWQAIVHLELGIRDSPSNFQFKLLLIRLYCLKGIFDPCPALYDNMEIKHIMNDTMGYIVANHVVRLGHLVGAGTMYTTVVRFFSLNQKEASEHLMSSYKFGTFARIQEFVEFQDRLDNSLQYHSANTEKLLLDLIMQTDRHDLTERAVECMNIHPKTSDKLDLSKLRDNRDLKISVCWDPPSEIQHEENQLKSLEEEKMWLRLRWLQLQVLLSAVWAGQEMAGVSVVNGNRSNKEGEENSESPLEVMNVRLKELQEHSNQCQHLSEPNQYHLLQGPFRTRISTHLCPPHLEVLTAMVDCINYLHSVQDQGLDKVNGEEELCWNNVQDIAKKLVLKDVDGLLKDVDGKRQLDSSALEQLVASVESISYVTLLVGVCNRVLKPLKATWSKRNKKGKGPAMPQPTTFENFNHLIKELSGTTKELHQITSGLDPVFSSLDIASLRLADIPEEEKPQREAERLVWSKVERSVQQSSREICEVLYHKQIYLNSLSL